MSKQAKTVAAVVVISKGVLGQRFIPLQIVRPMMPRRKSWGYYWTDAGMANEESAS